MKRKYYISEASGKVKMFSSFNQVLRYLKLSEEEEIKLADSMGRTAFTGNQDLSYTDDKLGICIDYK